MELIYFSKLKKINYGPLAVALGEFDGLHLAHQELIKKAINYSKEKGIKSAVISFDPHPDFVLKKRVNKGYLTPLKDKQAFLEKLGVDYFIIIPFTVELASLSPEAFIKDYLNVFQIEKLIVGFDYKFGFRGSGNPELLKKHFNLEVVERIEYNKQKIGSNEIREHLIKGEIKEVTALMGRYYNITGKVVMGNKVGRTIGIRTANVEIEEEYQILKKGVYAVYVYFGNNKYRGICNIGNNPTINYVKIPRLEVHIFDFDQEIYDQEISVDFVEFIRPEVKFRTAKVMVERIGVDIAKAKEILGVI